MSTSWPSRTKERQAASRAHGLPSFTSGSSAWVARPPWPCSLAVRLTIPRPALIARPLPTRCSRASAGQNGATSSSARAVAPRPGSSKETLWPSLPVWADNSRRMPAYLFAAVEWSVRFRGRSSDPVPRSTSTGRAEVRATALSQRARGRRVLRRRSGSAQGLPAHHFNPGGRATSSLMLGSSVISMRRFFARPSGTSFEAIGSNSP